MLNDTFNDIYLKLVNLKAISFDDLYKHITVSGLWTLLNTRSNLVIYGSYVNPRSKNNKEISTVYVFFNDYRFVSYNVCYLLFLYNPSFNCWQRFSRVESICKKSFDDKMTDSNLSSIYLSGEYNKVMHAENFKKVLNNYFSDLIGYYNHTYINL